MKYSGTRQKIRHGNSQRGRFVLCSSKSVRVLTYPRKRYIIKQEEMNRWTLQRYYTEPERRGRGIAGEMPVFIADDMESAESGRCIFWQIVTASAGGTAGGFCAKWRGDGEARPSGMYILLSGQNAQSTQKQERFCTITQKSRRIPEPGSNNWGTDGIWFPYACGNVIKCWFHMAFYSHFSKKVLTNLQKWFIIDT